MPGFLLDTNHLNAAIRPVSRVARVDRSVASGLDSRGNVHPGALRTGSGPPIERATVIPSPKP